MHTTLINIHYMLCRNTLRDMAMILTNTLGLLASSSKFSAVEMRLNSLRA